MRKSATIAFAATLFASSAALACSGWKNADNAKPITTAEAGTATTQSSAPWTADPSKQ